VFAVVGRDNSSIVNSYLGCDTAYPSVTKYSPKFESIKTPIARMITINASPKQKTITCDTNDYAEPSRSYGDLVMRSKNSITFPRTSRASAQALLAHLDVSERRFDLPSPHFEKISKHKSTRRTVNFSK
jgi:hypothetical protein